MATLQYRGPTPNSDGSVVTKAWADGQYAAIAVTTSWVNSQITTEVNNSNLQLPSYVDAQDALRAHKTSVDAADLNYVAVSRLGAASGVASLDSSGNLPLAQTPSGVTVSRVGSSYSLASGSGTQYLGVGATHTVNTQTPREFRLASITVPDPGYPWRPMCYGAVGGYSAGGSAPADRSMGTGNLGLALVVPPAGISDVIYGHAVCSGSTHLDFYPLLPYAVANETPLTIPPITGSLELGLWASCFSSSGYVFTGTGLQFTVQVQPAM